jgi:uncharacterized damage-inducible protein DinB
MLQDAFGHHVWASLRLIDACLKLTPEQLESTVPGTYGSILDTIRHFVTSDRGYLTLFDGGTLPQIGDDEEQTMDLAQLREVLVADGPAWEAVLASDPDPGEDLPRHRDDGTDSHAPIGIRLAQVVHHGTDHRSQVCTALTSLGIEPPEIDVWDYGRSEDRVFVTDSTGARLTE